MIEGVDVTKLGWMVHTRGDKMRPMETKVLMEGSRCCQMTSRISYSVWGTRFWTKALMNLNVSRDGLLR